MQPFSSFRTLGRVDARNIIRDPAVKWMVFLPVFIGLLIRFGLPPLEAYLTANWEFSLIPYYPLIGSFSIGLLVPMLLGMLVAFVLLDEKDDRTLEALLVSPLPLGIYFLYRVSLPILLSIGLTFIVAWASNLNILSPLELTLVAITAAPQAPLFALLVAVTAANKVQGFALMKAFSSIFGIGIFAYFVAPPLEWLFGLLPLYWPARLYWSLAEGLPGAGIYLWLGLLYQFLLLAFLLRQFAKVMHR